MRPEIKEYNYDWLMGGALNAAANLANATPKEYMATLRYTPYFKGIAESFHSIGESGAEILKLLSKYCENILCAKEQGKKLAITSFCLNPVLLYAMDIIPIGIEVLTTIACLMWERGNFDYLDFSCEAGLPETSCSAQRGALGAYLADLCENVDFVICNTPGSCDTNANAFAFSATYMDKPFFQLNQPSTIGDKRADKYHHDDHKELVRFLEKQVGKRMDWDRLAKLLEEVNKQDELVEELEDMHLMVPNPFSPLFTLGIYAGQFCFGGHKQYTQLLETMVKETRQRVEAGNSGLKSGKEKMRALVCYIDHYTVNTNFWNWLDDRGISHIGIMSKSLRDNEKNIKSFGDVSYGIDTTSSDAMLNSAAQLSSRMVMVREMRGAFDAPNMWLDEALTLAKMFHADCAIFNATPGCKNTWANVKLFAREIEKNGYPIHIMNDDGWDDRVESWEMTRERLDEFLSVRGLLE